MGGCRMLSGTGSSLIPGPGEKAGPGGNIFNVDAGWGGDNSGGTALAAPRKPSSGELIVARGGEEPFGERASGRAGSAPAAPPPA